MHDQPTVEKLAELVQRASMARDQSILEVARDATSSDRLLQEATDYPSMVGSEAVRLYNRMHWLSSHPRAPRFIGGKLVKAALSRNGSKSIEYVTGPLLETSQELLGDIALTTYYEVTTNLIPTWFSSGDWVTSQDIRLDRVSKDTDTGVISRDGLYSFEVLTCGGKAYDPQRINPNGPVFAEYRAARQLDLIAAYKEKFLASTVKIKRSNNEWVAKGSVNLEEAREVNTLLIKLNASHSEIDYPEEFYHFPLGLLMQTNKVLRGKVIK